MCTQVYLSQSKYRTLLGLPQGMSNICRFIPFTGCVPRYTPQGMSNICRYIPFTGCVPRYTPQGMSNICRYIPFTGCVPRYTPQGMSNICRYIPFTGCVSCTTQIVHLPQGICNCDVCIKSMVTWQEHHNSVGGKVHFSFL